MRQTTKINDPSLLDESPYEDAVVGVGNLAVHEATLQQVQPNKNEAQDDGVLVVSGSDEQSAAATEPADTTIVDTTTAQTPAGQQTSPASSRGYIEDEKDDATPILWGSA